MTDRTTNGVEERIPDAELEVLAYVQRRGGATGKQVRTGIADWRPLSHSSVMTLLGRLKDRGLVRRERAPGKQEYVYHATTTRDQAVEPILRRLLNRVFEGDAAGLVSSLFETRPPSAEEIERLEGLIEVLRREQREEPGEHREEREEEQQGVDGSGRGP